MVHTTDLEVEDRTDERVVFRLRFELNAPGAQSVVERYVIDDSGVEVRSRIGGGDAPAAARVTFPVLVSDGAQNTNVTIDASSLTVVHNGAKLTWEVLAPDDVAIRLEQPKFVSHAGFVQRAAAELPAGSREARWKVKLSAEASRD